MLEQVQNVIQWVIGITEQLLSGDSSGVIPILFACGVLGLGFDIIIAMNRRDGIEVLDND